MPRIVFVESNFAFLFIGRMCAINWPHWGSINGGGPKRIYC